MNQNNPRSDLQLIRARLGSDSIVLVGLMGAGKTTVGRRLAQKLGLSFVDADHEIERAAGMTAADIFEHHGEAHFRDGERRVIARLLESGPQVLATGGGAYMDETTRHNISAKGICVWLKCSHRLLMNRVRKRGHRPLLKTADPDAVMQELMDKRYPVYAQADLTVISRDVSHNTIVNDIIRELHQHYAPEAEQDSK